MHELIEQVIEQLRSSWRFRWWALAVAGVVAVLGWCVVFTLPDRFEANARVFVDTRTALKPVLDKLTIEQDVNAQLNFVRQSLLAGPELRKVATRTGVLPATTVDSAAESRILTGMASRITLTVRSASDNANDRDATAGSIYGLSYQDGSQERALNVVQVLLDTLVEKTLGGKRQGAENAQRFLEEQLRLYEQRLRTAEERLAEFKKRNIGLMPSEQGDYFAQLQTELDAVKATETQLSIALSKRAELSRQLRGESVVAASGTTTMIGAAGLGSSNDTLSRIKETQAKLDDLLLRFTDKHPDVVATRSTLVELQKRRDAEIESLKRGDPDAVAQSGASSNPVFQSIQLQLNQADVEIASLRGALVQHQSKAATLKQRLDSAPQVEAEFAQLNRDYDVNKTQYTALLSNYEKARLGEQADSAGSVRFEIVQPPIVSFAPVFPRRGLFLAGVLAGALAIGGGVAFLLHLLRPVVGSATSLARLTGLTVLGTVSAAFPGRSRSEQAGDLKRFATGVICLLAAFAAMVFLSRSGFRLHVGGGVG
jgi:polysaccharide chain length determinant protein (PEP-CTERM system associated)